MPTWTGDPAGAVRPKEQLLKYSICFASISLNLPMWGRSLGLLSVFKFSGGKKGQWEEVLIVWMFVQYLALFSYHIGILYIDQKLLIKEVTEKLRRFHGQAARTADRLKNAWELEKSFIDCEILAQIYGLFDKLSYVPSEETRMW